MISQDIVVPALIGAFAAIGTSFVERLVGRHFDKTAKAEALRDVEFDALKPVVFEIRDLATSYWASSNDGLGSDLAEAAIVGRLTFVSELLESLFQGNVDFLRQIQIATNRFDTACTSGSFGGKGREREPNRCRDIEIAAYTLVHRSSLLRRKL